MKKSYKFCIGNNSSPAMVEKIERFLNAISDIEGIIVNHDKLEVAYDVSKERLIEKLMDDYLLNIKEFKYEKE